LAFKEESPIPSTSAPALDMIGATMDNLLSMIRQTAGIAAGVAVGM